MKLDDLLRGINSTDVREANFGYLERYVNDAKGDFGSYSEVDSRYSPEQGEKQFGAPYQFIQPSKLHILRDNPDYRMENEVFVADAAKFIWHPDLPSPFSGNPDGYLKVSPTSSTRTLLTQGLQHNFMVKTDLDKRHFRFRRRLKGKSVAHSIAMNRDIAEAVASDSIPFYTYLPESLGFVYGDKHEGTGVLFRELTPSPWSNEPRQMIPYFSLYSQDSFLVQDIPLLVQLIELNSHYDPLGFFVNVIIGLVQDTWAYFVRERGILPELHGQNALLEIDTQGMPTRIVHRDFQSLYSDRDIRESKGLSQFDKHIVGVEDNISRHQQYSLVFDHMITRYLLERMVKLFIQFYPRYSFEDVVLQIRQRFGAIPDNRLDLFPPSIWRFSKQPMVDNNVVLVDTGEKPIFR